MRRPSGRNEFCSPYLETALALRPETYRYLDLIAFGFPCQDISHANPKGKGLGGEKSSIFFECMRIVDLLNPQWIIIENVPRLLSINKGRDFGVVLQTLAESGYGYQWRVLDSQYFGVPQRRKRIFVVGYFGGQCPPQVLFQSESSTGHDKKNPKPSPKSKCLNARTGYRQDSSVEAYICSTLTRRTGLHNFKNDTIVAKTIGAGNRGYNGFMWQENYIAEFDTNRKRETSRISEGLDTARGTVIGNAVTVPVIEWIGKRIVKYLSEQGGLT